MRASVGRRVGGELPLRGALFGAPGWRVPALFLLPYLHTEMPAPLEAAALGQMSRHMHTQRRHHRPGRGGQSAIIACSKPTLLLASSLYPVTKLACKLKCWRQGADREAQKSGAAPPPPPRAALAAAAGVSRNVRAQSLSSYSLSGAGSGLRPEIWREKWGARGVGEHALVARGSSCGSDVQ